jgi:hypothetical protein
MANKPSQDTLRNLLLSAGVFLLIMAIVPRLLPPPPMPAGTEPVAPSGAAPAPSAVPPGVGGQEPDRYGAWKVVEAEAVQTQTLGRMPPIFDPKNPPEYRMSLEVSNIGASVASARLADHRAALHSEERYEFIRPVEYATQDLALVSALSLAIEKINIDGEDILLHNKRWHMGEVESFRRSDPSGKRFRAFGWRCGSNFSGGNNRNSGLRERSSCRGNRRERSGMICMPTCGSRTFPVRSVMSC